MIKRETIQILSEVDKELLKSLLGRPIVGIYADGGTTTLTKSRFKLAGPLNFKTDGEEFLILTFERNEWYNEEFFQLNLSMAKKPSLAAMNPDGSLNPNYFFLSLSEKAEVIAISSYGFDAEETVSSLPFDIELFKQVQAAPGSEFRAVLSTEHILIFEFTSGAMMTIVPEFGSTSAAVSFDKADVSMIESGDGFSVPISLKNRLARDNA